MMDSVPFFFVGGIFRRLCGRQRFLLVKIFARRPAVAECHRRSTAYVRRDDLPFHESGLADASEQHRPLLRARLLPLSRRATRERDGKVIPKDCDSCHWVIGEAEIAKPAEATTPKLRSVHPVDIDDLNAVTCSDCHTGAFIQVGLMDCSKAPKPQEVVC
jgi:hypothetical protein